MSTDDFRSLISVYGLDSQVLANCFKAFASYLDVPKKEWNKYHTPYKDSVICVPSSLEVCTTDRVLPKPYIEKVPFPVKVKEHAMLAKVVNKSTRKSVEPDEKIAVEPIVA